MQVQSNTATLSGTVAIPVGVRHGNTGFGQPVQSLERSDEPKRTSRAVSTEAKPAISEEEAFTRRQDQLYAEFKPLVRRLIRQYGENAEIRNDLEGEIYYRFCVLLKAFDPERGVPLRPYLVRQLSASTYTFARQHWRSRQREVSLELITCEGSSRHSADPTPGWDAALDLQQFKRSLPAAIAKLSERQRNVLVWRYYEDQSFEEIASRLEVQTSTARSLLRHALTHLRADMAPPT